MAIIKEFKLGASVRVRGTFTDPSTGAAIDPSVVKVSYRKGTDAIVTKTFGTDVEVVKEAAGIYYLDLDLNAVGNWYWRIWSTGTGQTADEGTIKVVQSNFD